MWVAPMKDFPDQLCQCQTPFFIILLLTIVRCCSVDWVLVLFLQTLYWHLNNFNLFIQQTGGTVGCGGTVHIHTSLVTRFCKQHLLQVSQRGCVGYSSLKNTPKATVQCGWDQDCWRAIPENFDCKSVEVCRQLLSTDRRRKPSSWDARFAAYLWHPQSYWTWHSACR